MRNPTSTPRDFTQSSLRLPPNHNLLRVVGVVPARAHFVAQVRGQHLDLLVRPAHHRRPHVHQETWGSEARARVCKLAGACTAAAAILEGRRDGKGEEEKEKK